MPSLAEHHTALREVGYTVLPAVYDEAQMRLSSDALERLYDGLGRPALSGQGRNHLPGFDAFTTPIGLTISKLLRHAPELIPGFLHDDVLAVLRHVLGDELRVETTGATISDNDRPIHAWHNHVGGRDEDLPLEQRPGRVDPTRIRRMTLLVYIDPIEPATGQLLLYPRALADSLDTPYPDQLHQAWPGQAAISCPTGSAVLIEERTWHAALPRTQPGIRRFMGAWFAAGWVPPSVDNIDDSVAEFGDAMLRRAKTTH